MYKQYFGLFNSKNEVKNQGTDGVLGKCMYEQGNKGKGFTSIIVLLLTSLSVDIKIYRKSHFFSSLKNFCY